MRILREAFGDWITRTAAIVFLLIIALVIFNEYSTLPVQFPLFGVFIFAGVPILFVAGGVIFVLAILAEAPARDKLVFLMTGGAIGIVLLVIGGYQLVQFTDSTAFCGRLCHSVMHPEFTVYQVSPHSRVLCVDCHVGPGAGYLVKSKLAGVPLILATITGNYDRPIPAPVHSLRPARETCEQCHWPQRFTGDFVVQHTVFAPDENNTQSTDTRILRVGGGQAGSAQGIHWHVASTMDYLALDEARQDIAWVGVQSENGRIDYLNPGEALQVNETRIEKDARLMDCVDCHNRATHQFNSPEGLLDNAFLQGQVDATLPYLKKEATAALDPVNSSLQEAYNKIESIADFYRSNYPDVYRQEQSAIDQAIGVFKGIADLTTFPDMKVSWETYVNNIGHQSSLGCFRCHGRLVAQNGPRQGQTISAECTLCHYLIQGPIPK